MTARPILFSGPMVCALLEGRKTQTRRPVKFRGEVAKHEDIEQAQAMFDLGALKCPYGEPGDLLYVRETWAVADEWLNDCETDPPSVIAYRADTAVQSFDPPHFYPKWPEHWGNYDDLKWRASILMFRWASRLTLHIKAVRVERLNDISESDAGAEGCDKSTFDFGEGRGIDVIPARDAYRDLWESINGIGTWVTNPWVWVVDFSVERANVDRVILPKTPQPSRESA